jgi:hypothetical protein
MYVAKIHRDGVKWTANIFEKHWSETMLSHEVLQISKRRFFFRFSAVRWTDREICRRLVQRHELEIIDG